MSAFFFDLHSNAGETSAPWELDSDCMEPPEDKGPSREAAVFRGRSYPCTSRSDLDIELEQELDLLIGDCGEAADLSGLETNLLTLFRRKEKDLILAAKIGKTLLERNEELTKQYENIHRNLNERLEQTEQERHELRRRLEARQGEWEARVAELEMDLQQLQGKLELQQARARELDREKNQAVTELLEQNHKLLEQLSRATEAERVLSTQVQVLREDFRKKNISINQHISRLESLQAEIRCLSERKRELERRMNAVRRENEVLHAAVDELHERALALEKNCREKDLQLRQSQLDLQEVRVSRQQLDLHLEELNQEGSSVEPDSQTFSLQCEMEREEEEENQVSTELRSRLPDTRCQVGSLYLHLRGSNAMEPILSCNTLTARDPSATGLHGDLLDSAESTISPHCDEEVLEDQVRRLREELQGSRESYKEEQERFCSSQQEVLQLHSQVALLSVELCSVREEAGSLRALAEAREPGERLLSAIRDRDDAVAKKNAMEMELAQCKIDIMSLNSQLLDAIHQKLSLSQQLEAWQDDMLRIVNQQLMDKHQDEFWVSPYSFSGGNARLASTAARCHGNGDKKLFSFFKKN
ncbi:BICD family-like cargo adapter 1 isoform X1 [Paramormyrops kingsleyae]|uniref:BICD family-like cargo adapter 1 isoform X1 n=1 Tax=Paramormyrops kingsleyae TaxID=1676925 RepID=UPI003B97067C